jgi:hypothetical protein
MTTYHGINACCICALYTVFCRFPWLSTRDGPEVNSECLCSGCDKEGHAEPLTLRAKVGALLQFQRTIVCRKHIQIWYRSSIMNKECAKSIDKKRYTWNAREKKCSFLLLFRNTPCDEIELRTTICHGIKARCFCTICLVRVFHFFYHTCSRKSGVPEVQFECLRCKCQEKRQCRASGAPF